MPTAYRSNEQNGAYVRAQQMGKALGSSISNIGNYTAQAASRANGVSFASQAAQGAFNQASANIANALGDERLLSQYAYNSAGATNANEFTEYMWNQAAEFNREMAEAQMKFNSEEAQKNRDWQEKMRATAYQTAIKDMEKSGLNPILAVMNGGVGATGGMSGSTASASLPTMSSAQGAMATGGLLNGISANEGNFQGQMEYMGGILGILSAVINGVSSAMSGLGSLGDIGEGIAEGIAKIFNSANKKDFNDVVEDIKQDINNDPINWFSGNPYARNVIYGNGRKGAYKGNR